MLANQLTQPLSRKLLFGLLLVTIGADTALFLSRGSYFMETIYSNILLFSIIIAMKLAPRLKDHSLVISKRKQFSLFVKAFFMLYLVGMINNYFSNQTFKDFSEDRNTIAEDFTEKVQSFEEESSSTDSEYTISDRVNEWLDSIGYDFYNYFLAGLEEVWRIAYIVLFLSLFKRVLPRLWEKSSKDLFLIIAVILSSLLFGVGHSLSTEQNWSVFIGTVVSFTNMGLVLGYLMVSIRNLWLLIFVHGLYDVLTSFSWSYFTWTTEVFVGLILIINGIMWIVDRIRSNIEEAKSFEL